MSTTLEEYLFSEVINNHYTITDIQETENELIIEFKSQKHSCVCPNCGKETTFVQETFVRTLQDLPLNNKKVILKIHVNEYVCLNPDCKTKMFEDQLNFVRPYGHRTYRLDSFILAVSMFLSNEGASRVLKQIGVDISADSIKRIYDRLEFADDSEVEEIGIDDVALLKGHNYGTVIYDRNDHHMIALFKGRDKESVKEWLLNHPKIKRVARDRASAYAMALDEILPDCLQVADRFHLFQNITTHLEEAFRNELPSKFFFKEGKLLKEEPEKIYREREISDKRKQELDKLKIDNLPPVDEEGNLIVYDAKLRQLNGKQYKEQEKKRKQKQALIIKIQEYWNSPGKKTLQPTAKLFGISVNTLRKYLKMTDQEIKALDHITEYKPRKKPMDNYVNIIYKMIGDDYSPLDIKYYVSHLKGFPCSNSLLEHYIQSITANNFPQKSFDSRRVFKTETYPEDIKVIPRRDVLNFIIKNQNPDPEFNKCFEMIKEEFPLVETLEQAYQDFYSVVMGDDPDALDTFLENYENTACLAGFCQSIKKDMVAVKNSISSEISSGFVEGLNCKFKLIKRILYGRANPVNLERKCKLAFLPYDDDQNSYHLDELVKKKT